MKKNMLPGALALSLVPLLLSAPYASADFIYKSFGCPKNNLQVVPKGTRFEIDDIIISANKDQQVTLKFNPGDRKLMKIFMKAKIPFTTNLNKAAEGEDKQGLQMDCSGNSGTTVTVTITGSGNL